MSPRPVCSRARARTERRQRERKRARQRDKENKRGNATLPLLRPSSAAWLPLQDHCFPPLPHFLTELALAGRFESARELESRDNLSDTFTVIDSCLPRAFSRTRRWVVSPRMASANGFPRETRRRNRDSRLVRSVSLTRSHRSVPRDRRDHPSG